MIDHVSTRSHTFLNPGRLTGPIFDKELRVSSRRRRSYVLRVLYILALTVFVGVVWMAVVQYHGSASYVQSRMAVAGKQVIRTIVFFQFVAMQVLAVVMLSTAISDEVYHRTLGILMTTPINSLQIVMGKMLSRLLQLVLLLAISLPMLAIMRVFGGVPWGYLLSSLCITLTAALFAGAVSLWFSINNRVAYGVILRTLFTLFVLYVVMPALLSLAAYYLVPKLGININKLNPTNYVWLGVLVASLNPFISMLAITEQMLSPRGPVPFSLPLHCGVMLGLSALVLGWSVRVVRRVALRQAVGILAEGRVPNPQSAIRNPKSSGVRRVVGLPVVWKELRAPFIQGLNSRNSYIGLGVTIAALLLTYWGSAHSGNLDEDFTHTMYVMLFIFLGIIVSIVFSATRITTEKETQSWMLLLATPLSDWDILFGKAVSAFRRCLPIWGLLAGHVVLFTAVHYIHPVAIIHLMVLVAWLTCFLLGAGLYFSARLRRTTSAVVACLALAAGLWIAGPILAGLAGQMSRGKDLFAKYMWTHPVTQTSLIMTGAGGAQNAALPWRSLGYEAGLVTRPDRETLGVGKMTWILATIAAVYIFVGFLFFWRAKCWLRRKCFD